MNEIINTLASWGAGGITMATLFLFIPMIIGFGFFLQEYRWWFICSHIFLVFFPLLITYLALLCVAGWLCVLSGQIPLIRSQAKLR